jgi:hypothetical protein
MIWNLAINHVNPRIVRWHPKSRGNKIPSILHVCFESRTEAKKSYHRVVCSDSAYSFASGSGYALFINYEIDVLYIDTVPHSARTSGVMDNGSISSPMDVRDIASTNLDRRRITQLMLSEGYLQSSTAGGSYPGSYQQTSSLCLRFQKLKTVLIAVDSLVADSCPDTFSTNMVYDLSNYRRVLTRSCRRRYGRIVCAFILNLEANRRYSPDEIAYLRTEKARVDTVRVVKFEVPHAIPYSLIFPNAEQRTDVVVPLKSSFPWQMADSPRSR